MNPAVAIGKYAAGEGKSAAGLLPRCLVPILGGLAAALVFRSTDIDEAAVPSGRLPGLSADAVRRFGAFANEAVGTGFLTSSIAIALGTGNLPAPVAAGLALTALAFGGGFVSGAHLNPAVSLGVHLLNKARFPLQQILGYSAAQTGGALMAALGVKRILGAGAMAGQLPLPGPGAGNALQVFATEATFTALLVSSVLCNAGSHQLGPLAIAAALTGGLFGASKISGGGLNPAAATALFLSNGKEQVVKDYLWIYVLAPLVGAVLGTMSVQLTAEGGK